MVQDDAVPVQDASEIAERRLLITRTSAVANFRMHSIAGSFMQRTRFGRTLNSSNRHISGLTATGPWIRPFIP
jgi:hypothetical protein